MRKWKVDQGIRLQPKFTMQAIHDLLFCDALWEVYFADVGM
jgi:hypothetical protein